MRALTLALAASLAQAGAAFAGDPGPAACDEARHLAQAETALPRVAAAIKERHSLKIVVIGTGSSVLAGPNGERAAYPARLEAALREMLSGVAVAVVADIRPRRTAAEMKAETFNRIVDERPALVVWQTGTVDAMRGVDPDDFRLTLDKGVEKLQANGADVVFMNMQFSPRTESMIAAGVYADNMRWVALQHEVPLFDRFAIMKHWVEAGTFDLYAASKHPEIAERVHDCIGRLLGELIVDSAKGADTAPQPAK
jgi:hypothetical protein